jgi:GNAT superfamily N-acetyltransferase
MLIRKAEPRDLDAMCQLYVAFHEFHVKGRPDRLSSLGRSDTFDCTDLVHTLTRLLLQADAALFVADMDSRIVGVAEVYLRHDEASAAKQGCHYGYLQSLMVDAAVRGHGIGTELVAAAERWAWHQGATEMRLDTWEFPAGPLPFYEGVGYQTLRRTLVRSINP